MASDNKQNFLQAMNYLINVTIFLYKVDIYIYFNFEMYFDIIFANFSCDMKEIHIKKQPYINNRP